MWEGDRAREREELKQDWSQEGRELGLHGAEEERGVWLTECLAAGVVG